MRKRIFDLLDSLYPTYSIGQHEGECESPYLVVKFNNQSTSVNNSNCGWQPFEIMIYIPQSSIAPMEGIIEEIKTALNDKFEFTGDITPDYLDTEVKAYMRSMKYRIPKQIM